MRGWMVLLAIGVAGSAFAQTAPYGDAAIARVMSDRYGAAAGRNATTLLAAAETRRRIFRFANQEHFSGTIGSEDAQHNQSIDAFGSFGQDDPLPEQTVWRWASVTKQVVAVLVMQEVERGHIDLDAPALRYLPGVALPGGDAVTVRRLLNHTSGLYDPNGGPAGPDGTPLAYLRSATAAPGGLDPQCLKPSGRAPGSGFIYNNCDYVVLGSLLKAVTGQPFATLIKERIAKPLGLKSLRVLKPGDRDNVVGVGEHGATDANVDPGRYGSAANLAGTPADLLAFDRALLTNALLGPAATAELTRGDPKSGYAALGVWSYPVKLRGCTAAQNVVERRGEVGFVQVRNLIAPDRGVAIVAFTATSTTDFGEPWQGKGLTYELLSAALCPEARP